MVRIEPLTSANFTKYHTRAYRLVRKNGARHILATTRAWLKEYCPQNGGGVWLAFEERKLIGVSGTSGDDNKVNFTVVRAAFRRRGVRTLLMQTKLEGRKKYVTRVSTENAPSLGLVFKVGLCATEVEQRNEHGYVLRFEQKRG